MNRRLVMFGCLCLMICGCNESKTFSGNWGTCNADFVPLCLSESTSLKCVDGHISEVACDSGVTCQDGICGTSQGCGADSVACDGNTLVECKGGKETRTDCPNGCENNACKQPVVSTCGNNIIEGEDVCDGSDLGSLTCADLPDADAQAIYSGTPECKADCSGIEQGTCVASHCGNGIIEPEYNEICEVIDGEAQFLNKPSCNDYKSNISWRDGGAPGCDSDCMTLTKGSCVAEGEPIGNIQTCQLVSLDADDSTQTVTMKGRIVVEPGVDMSMVAGRMVCILHDNSEGVYTYAWGLKQDADLVSCADCETDEYLLSASMKYENWGPGIYDCAFLANAQGGSNSYYLCAAEMGSPVPQEKDVPDASQRAQFEVALTGIEGELLAQWTYSAYQKDDTATSVAADRGVFASGSTMKLSDGGTIRMLSGSSGYPDAAASMDRLPQNEEYSSDEKHFVFTTSSLGYRNIRIQFKAAGSGVYEKRITVGYKVGDIIQTAGSELRFDDKNIYQAFPESQLTGADNMSELEIRIYPYGGSGDVNASVRIDDVYVTGDKM